MTALSLSPQQDSEAVFALQRGGKLAMRSTVPWLGQRTSRLPTRRVWHGSVM